MNTDEPKNVGSPVAAVLDTSALPTESDRTTWQAELDKLLVREKAHTREGDAGLVSCWESTLQERCRPVRVVERREGVMR